MCFAVAPGLRGYRVSRVARVGGEKPLVTWEWVPGVLFCRSDQAEIILPLERVHSGRRKTGSPKVVLVVQLRALRL